MEGVIRSPNIWEHPATYEIENRAVDPHGTLWERMLAIHDPAQQTVLDIGCGTGFYLPLFARTARAVVGIEPHPGLAEAAARRCRDLANVEVRRGTAQRQPVADASIDLAHARWAYFFSADCTPGLRELDRVMRRGGTAMIIDNDTTRSTFGAWCRRAFGSVWDSRDLERFFATRGWNRESIDMGWAFQRRADLEAVVRIEFEARWAEQFIAEHQGLEVDYAVNLWWKRY